MFPRERDLRETSAVVVPSKSPVTKVNVAFRDVLMVSLIASALATIFQKARTGKLFHVTCLLCCYKVSTQNLHGELKSCDFVRSTGTHGCSQQVVSLKRPLVH